MALKLGSYPLILFGFLLSVVYIPGIVGASISTGWLFLFILMPVIICFYKIPIKPSHVIGSLFLIYASISLFWTYSLNIGFFYLLQLIALSLCFCLGSALFDIKPIIKGLSIGLLISVIVAFAQYFNWHDVFSVNNNPAGLFVNTNVFCEICAIILICLLVFKLYWWIAIPIPGLLLVHSRAAILGTMVGLIAISWSKSKFYTFLFLFVGIILGSVYYIDHSNLPSINQRFALWVDTFNGLKLFGNGVGSFESMYPFYSLNTETWLERPKYAHNDLLQIVFEYGIGSLFLIWFVLNILKIKCEKRIILYAIGTISLFSFPFHIPVSAFIGCLVAGFISRHDAADGDFRNNWGSILFKRNKE